jgi:8-oxo-dGTP diphosphatase
VTTVVAAAILDGEPLRLLAAQRAYPAALAGQWELPGGKVGDGEEETAALVRECREELGVEVVLLDRVGTDTPTVGGTGTLRVWWARLRDGEPRPLEHAALRWLGRDELGDVAWLDADEPVVAAIRAGWPST